MHLRKQPFFILIGVSFLFAAAFLFLLPSEKASAQCGSQASSCKNCHETQGKKPVNTDGTGWHQGHAFGDFCYACHGGNNQSMDETAAHTGMVPPMSDVKTACQGCHPNDLNERVAKYAAVLGVQAGTGDSTPAGESTPEGQPTQAATPVPAGSSSTTTGTGSTAGSVLPGGSGIVTDYSQRYDDTAAGKLPVNWGNVILVVLIVLVALGGGAFVYINERKRLGLPLVKTAPKAGAAALPIIEGYAPEVVSILPLVSRLNPMGLHSLKKILQNPEQANELLHSLAQLDPELVRRIRSLDRDSRELLLAIAGD